MKFFGSSGATPGPFSTWAARSIRPARVMPSAWDICCATAVKLEAWLTWRSGMSAKARVATRVRGRKEPADRQGHAHHRHGRGGAEPAGRADGDPAGDGGDDQGALEAEL